MASTHVSIWSYRVGVLGADNLDTTDITGYSIHAVDGDIGKVDKHNNETGSAYVLVTTGPWIFGKTVMLPVGVIERIDHENKNVYVSVTKDQIKNAPEYDANRHEDQGYRNDLGGYYGGGGGLPA
jgi:hypothetical protein